MPETEAESCWTVRGNCPVCDGVLRQLGHDEKRAWAACRMCGTAIVAHFGASVEREMHRPLLIDRVRTMLEDPYSQRLNLGPLEECVLRPAFRAGGDNNVQT